MQKRWKVRKVDEEKVSLLHKALKINRVICTLLVQRGFDTFDKAKQFFRPQLLGPSRPLVNEGYG
jgi:single-stranded-DNA-specific exonuclease